MITDRIGRHKVLLPINHENYNFPEKKNSQDMKERENKFALKDAKRRTLFDVALTLTTIKMDVIG